MVASGSVGFRKWTYFHFDVVAPGQEATVRMHETNSIPVHDCDLFAQVDDYPTARSYYRKDTGVGRDAVIPINSTAPRGTWYIGVFGFLGCSFQVTLSAPTNNCPNGCSGNGTCGAGGICSCSPGFGGPDCLALNRTIAFGTPATGHVLRRNWTYYYFDLTETKERVVIALSSPGDTDLYVRKNAFPTLFTFDSVNASTPMPGVPDLATVVLQSPEATRWYIGVYGWAESDYTLTLAASVFANTVCPNNCSLAVHGTCTGGRCQCNPGFHGDTCEYQDEDLVVGGDTSVGYVDSGQWNYFTVTSDSAGILNVTALMNTGVTPMGDCDLYIRAEDFPNRTAFDAADLGFGAQMHVSVSSPGNQRYFVGVFGWRACAFSVAATEEDPAANCGPHGTQVNGSCVCSDRQYFGEECEITATELHSNAAPLQGSVATGSWQYFFIQASATAFTFTVKESSPGARGGLVGLFAQVDSAPTDHDYLQRDTSLLSMHFVHLEFPAAQARTVVVGVFANGFGGEHVSTPYQISAFAF